MQCDPICTAICGADHTQSDICARSAKNISATRGDGCVGIHRPASGGRLNEHITARGGYITIHRLVDVPSGNDSNITRSTGDQSRLLQIILRTEQNVAGTACETKVQCNAINLASGGIRRSISRDKINRPCPAGCDCTIHDNVVGRIDRDVSSDAADRGTSEHITIGAQCLQQHIASPAGRDGQGICVTIVQSQRANGSLKFNGTVIRRNQIAQPIISLSCQTGVRIH